MSLATEVTRITNLRNTIRTKLINLGIITDSSANLSTCTTAINNIGTSSLSAPTISITPTISVNTSTGLVSVSGSGSGTASVSQGYTPGASSTVTASASNTYSIAVYDGTIT